MKEHFTIIWSRSWVVALLVFAGAGDARAEQGATQPRVTHQNNLHCGASYGLVGPPVTHAQADIDGDGTEEHFFATAQGVEQFVVQEGTVPETLVHEATIYRSRVRDVYTCTDLRLVDLDGDHDLDMVFASPRELVVLELRRGRYVVTRRDALDLEPTTRVHITINGQSISAS